MKRQIFCMSDSERDFVKSVYEDDGCTVVNEIEGDVQGTWFVIVDCATRASTTNSQETGNRGN